MDVVGMTTGSLLPKGNSRDVVGGIDVTCMDVAMPMIIARAADLRLTGHETVAELEKDRDFFDKMEQVRIEAGALMGMGDVSQSVTPKFDVLAPTHNGGTVVVRHSMPWNAHRSMAVTGAQCLASCAPTAGTVSDGLLNQPMVLPARAWYWSMLQAISTCW